MKRLLTLVCLVSLLLSGCSANSPADDEIATLDLTILGSTMQSAEYGNMMRNPEAYRGTTIKARGSYMAIFSENDDRYFHFIVTKEGDICCQERFEFILNDKNAFPGDYPEEQAIIEIVGVFDSYNENGITRFFLDVEEINVLT